MDEEERWTVGVKLYRKSSSGLGGFYYFGLKKNVLIVPQNEGETEKNVAKLRFNPPHFG